MIQGTAAGGHHFIQLLLIYFSVIIFFLGYNICSLITIFTHDSYEAIARAVFHDYANFVMFLIIGSILAIIPLVYAIMDSARNENKYGPSPKYQN